MISADPLSQGGWSLLNYAVLITLGQSVWRNGALCWVDCLPLPPPLPPPPTSSYEILATWWTGNVFCGEKRFSFPLSVRNTQASSWSRRSRLAVLPILGQNEPNKSFSTCSIIIIIPSERYVPQSCLWPSDFGSFNLHSKLKANPNWYCPSTVCSYFLHIWECLPPHDGWQRLRERMWVIWALEGFLGAERSLFQWQACSNTRSSLLLHIWRDPVSSSIVPVLHICYWLYATLCFVFAQIVLRTVVDGFHNVPNRYYASFFAPLGVLFKVSMERLLLNCVKLAAKDL